MRGSLSSLTAAIIILLTLTSTLTYISLELRKVPTQVSKVNYELVSRLSNSVRDAYLEFSDEGLYIRSNNPPIKVLSVLNVSDSGINRLMSNLTINTTRELILNKELMINSLSSGYLIILLDNGKYFIVDKDSLSNSTSNNVFRDSLDLLNTTYLRPILYVGILKDLNSFMNNPIPGLPSDPESNYLPVGYTLITSDIHTVSKGSWYLYADPRSNPNKVGMVFGNGSTTVSYLGMGYYTINSEHNVYTKWYELVSGSTSGWYISYETIMAGVVGWWLYPVVVSVNRSTLTLTFMVKNLGGWVTMYLRPVAYVVSPEDFIRGTLIIPYQVNPTLESVIRYSITKPYYVWEGSVQGGTLSSGSTLDTSLSLDFKSVLNSLGLSRALVLVGFRYASTSGVSIKVTTFIHDYDVKFSLGSDEVGKYVFIPASNNVVPEVIAPSGSKVQLYRPTNLYTSVIDYPVVFIPSESGTYVIRYKSAPYTLIPQVRLSINLTQNSYNPVLEYLRNQHLGYSNYVVNDSITLELGRAVLRDHEYFEAGSETWYSGDLLVVNGLPSSGQYNFTYYINSLVQGYTTLNLNQNSSRDYYYCWSSWSCYYYWRIYFTSYPNGSVTKLYIRGDVLYPSGSYYLRFGVYVPLADTQVTTTPTTSGIKVVYKYGNSPYVIYIASQFTELVRLSNNVLILN
jgi:hypothetical protein